MYTSRCRSRWTRAATCRCTGVLWRTERLRARRQRRRRARRRDDDGGYGGETRRESETRTARIPRSWGWPRVVRRWAGKTMGSDRVRERHGAGSAATQRRADHWNLQQVLSVVCVCSFECVASDSGSFWSGAAAGGPHIFSWGLGVVRASAPLVPILMPPSLSRHPHPPYVASPGSTTDHPSPQFARLPDPTPAPQCRFHGSCDTRDPPRTTDRFGRPILPQHRRPAAMHSFTATTAAQPVTHTTLNAVRRTPTHTDGPA